MASDDGGSSFITGFMLGGIVGVVVGILIAPKSGSETRAGLLEQSDALRAKAEELGARIGERVGPTVDVVRERVGPTMESVRERIAPAVEGVRERVAPIAERVTSRVGPSTASPETDGGPVAPAATEEDAVPEAEEKA